MTNNQNPAPQAGNGSGPVTGGGDGGNDSAPKRPDPEQLLTPKEAAALLGLSPRAIENWRGRGGGMKFVRISRRCVRYRRQDVLDFITERTFVSTADEAMS